MKRTRYTPASARPRGAAGFTLMEVMIVVVIVGILLAVALPGYENSMQKGRRNDAKAALMDVANRQEQFMLDRSTYTINLAELNIATESPDGYYTITAAACGTGTIATCYLLTATPVAGRAQANDTSCSSMTLDSRGTKSPPTGCW